MTTSAATVADRVGDPMPSAVAAVQTTAEVVIPVLADVERQLHPAVTVPVGRLRQKSTRKTFQSR